MKKSSITRLWISVIFVGIIVFMYTSLFCTNHERGVIIAPEDTLVYRYVASDDFSGSDTCEVIINCSIYDGLYKSQISVRTDPCSAYKIIFLRNNDHRGFISTEVDSTSRGWVLATKDARYIQSPYWFYQLKQKK